jgi:hypothetical protein
MNSLMATRIRGIHPPCSFSSIKCFDCGESNPVRRGGNSGIKFFVCDSCFTNWVSYIFYYNGDWCVYLVQPYKCLIMSSPRLSDAVQSSIDFSGIADDKTWSRKWIKIHLRKLLRLGEKNF